MASNRHLGRIVALQVLYEYDFRSTIDAPQMLDIEEIINRDFERYQKDIDDRTFIDQLVKGVMERSDELDTQIQPLAPDWPIAQIARVDRVILRLGLYELLHCASSVPPKVAINEAVELAKSFGSDNSSKFINGVLGTAYRTLVENQDETTKV